MHLLHAAACSSGTLQICMMFSDAMAVCALQKPGTFNLSALDNGVTSREVRSSKWLRESCQVLPGSGTHVQAVCLRFAVLAHCGLHGRSGVGAVLLCGRRLSGWAVIQRGCSGQPRRLLALSGAGDLSPLLYEVLLSPSCDMSAHPVKVSAASGRCVRLQEHRERLTAALDAAGMKVSSHTESHMGDCSVPCTSGHAVVPGGL